MLVRQGYTVSSLWTEKYYDVPDNGPLWSMALLKLHNTRVLLWPEKDHWRAVICVAVGKNGEFPIAQGRIERGNKDKFPPPFAKMEQKIMAACNQVNRWGFQPANTYSAQALARLAEYYMSKKHYRKARIAQAGIINGVLNAATVSEALSIVQTMVARTREDRIESAMIWSEVYR